MRTFAFVSLLLSFTLLGACTKNESSDSGTQDPAVKLANKGRATFMAQCISCHNADPAKDGSLGPAVAGSSRELLEARVLRAEYPAGYAPKRPSKVMPPMPHLKNEIDALAAYLNASPEAK